MWGSSRHMYKGVFICCFWDTARPWIVLVIATRLQHACRGSLWTEELFAMAKPLLGSRWITVFRGLWWQSVASILTQKLHMSRNNEGMGTWMTLGGQHALPHATWKEGLGSGRAHYWSTVRATVLREAAERCVGDNEVPLQGCTQLSASPMIKNFQRESFCVNSFSDLQNSPEHMAKKLQLALFLRKLISRKVAFLWSQSGCGPEAP